METIEMPQDLSKFPGNGDRFIIYEINVPVDAIEIIPLEAIYYQGDGGGRNSCFAN